MARAKSLPLLDHLRRELKPRTEAPFVFLVIQHLLADAPSLIRALLDLGCEKQDMTVIGIWYSTKVPVVAELKKHGFTVHTPTNDSDMERTVAQVVPKLLAQCKATKKRLAIVEDGGYAVPLIHDKHRTTAKLVAGAVEQTTRGLWKDERHQDSSGNLMFPVVSIPDCALKRNFEPPFVAEAVVNRLGSIMLNHLEDSLRDKEVVLVGYGSVGSAVASDLRSQGARVKVWDRVAVRRSAAAAAGFEVLQDEFDFGNAQIIIGATGAIDGPSIKEEHFLRRVVTDQAVLVSVSSRREEIEMPYLEKHAKRTQIRHVGGRYLLPDGREITVLADGAPLNFFEAESATSRAMQLILALLFEGARVLTEPGAKPMAQILRGGTIDEERLATLWLDIRHQRLHDPRFYDNVPKVGATIEQATAGSTS